MNNYAVQGYNTKQYKAYTITAIVLFIVFMIFTIFMGIFSDMILSQKQSNIVFWCWLGYTIAMFAGLGVWAFPVWKGRIRYIASLYDFDRTKQKKLEQTSFENLNVAVTSLTFTKTKVIVNGKEYKHNELIYQYDSASASHGVLLYMTNLKDSDIEDLTYIIEVTQPIYHCLKFYNLNAQDLDYFVDEIINKVK